MVSETKDGCMGLLTKWKWKRKKSAKIFNIEERTSKAKMLNVLQILHDNYLILVHLRKINDL